MAAVEGTVRVSYAGETTSEITAGEEARIPHVGLLTRVTAADTARAIAWRQRRFVFPEDRLEDIAAGSSTGITARRKSARRAPR